MEDHGMVENLSVLFVYVTFLEQCDLLTFSTELQNAYEFLLEDVMGRGLIAITISLTIKGEVLASTPLHGFLFNICPQRENIFVWYSIFKKFPRWLFYLRKSSVQKAWCSLFIFREGCYNNSVFLL